VGAEPDGYGPEAADADAEDGSCEEHGGVIGGDTGNDIGKDEYQAQPIRAKRRSSRPRMTGSKCAETAATRPGAVTFRRCPHRCAGRCGCR
jgi:hypothetical protein